MIFKGTATALITPFTDDKVDADALDTIVDFQLENGVSALVVLGTTAETATLSEDEKEDVVKRVVRRAKGKIPIIVGAGSNCTQHAVDLARRAQTLGADGLLVVTPYYNKCTQEGLVRHYDKIAKSTSLPILCYNVPSRTGVNMLPKTFLRLLDNDNIVGIKEASGNMAQILEYLALCQGRASIISGDDALCVPTMAMGGDGVISVASNAFPRYMSDMTNCVLKGKYAIASKMQLDLLPFVNALFCEVNPIPIKEVMSLLGFCKHDVRLPLCEMSQSNATMLEKELERIKNLANISPNMTIGQRI